VRGDHFRRALCGPIPTQHRVMWWSRASSGFRLLDSRQRTGLPHTHFRGRQSGSDGPRPGGSAARAGPRRLL